MSKSSLIPAVSAHPFLFSSSSQPWSTFSEASNPDHWDHHLPETCQPSHQPNPPSRILPTLPFLYPQALPTHQDSPLLSEGLFLVNQNGSNGQDPDCLPPDQTHLLCLHCWEPVGGMLGGC